ncbi:Protein patched 1 [Liparis tanakae]|uniref:Protein patched 1 n=1 Tax=Liparis tanakae TaxID=230148 RepID=A0A4Z2ERP3_9TELE|nr:Protein patched 1 [Liparis tanakae]
MASDRGVPGSGVYGDLPPSYTRSRPPANPDVLRRPSYCHAAFALKQISKVIQCPQNGVWMYLEGKLPIQSARV